MSSALEELAKHYESRTKELQELVAEQAAEIERLKTLVTDVIMMLKGNAIEIQRDFDSSRSP